MSERRPFSQPPKHPRPHVRIIFMLVLIIGLAAAIHMLLSRPGPTMPDAVPTLPVTDSEAQLHNDTSPLTTSMDMIDEPLDAEPAGLPAWPGEGAVRGFGFRRPLGDRVDDVVVWQLPGTAKIDDVLAFYGAAAKAMGFDRLEAQPGSVNDDANEQSHLFHRESGAGLQTLTIRLAESADGLRVTLWFQYPIATPADAMNPSPGNREAMHE